MNGVLSRKQREYLEKGRIARLATVDQKNSVHLVPIVFANRGNTIYFVIDRKTKTGRELKRLKNIYETGRASLLIDNYSENWEELSFLLLTCSATVIGHGASLSEKRFAAKELKRKYAQYARGDYFPENIDAAIFVRLEPQKAVFWQNLRRSLA